MVGLLRPRELALVAGYLLLAVSAASTTSLASERPALSGLVLDELGNLVRNAQILILPRKAGAPPVVETRSDDNGRYSIAELRPDLYRVAVVKEGYLTFLGQVDTFVRSSLDMVLQPAPASGVELPEDSSWMLRLPRRSVLREVAGETLLATAQNETSSRGGSSVMQSSIERSLLQGQVEQLLARTGTQADEQGNHISGRGSTTRVHVGALLRQKGSIGVEAYRQRLNTVAGGASRLPAAKRNDAQFLIDLDYETSVDGRLAVQAFYEEASLDRPADEVANASPSAYQGQRTWGYDASWSRQLDAGSRVQVEMDYAKTALVLLAEDSGVEAVGLHRSSQSLMGAAGTFESTTGAGHQVKLGVRAQRLEREAPALGASLVTPAMQHPLSDPGWNVQLDAEHLWSVTAPLSVVYGMGYHRNLHRADSVLVVPRAGAMWGGSGLRMSVVLSYHTSARRPGSFSPPDETVRSRNASPLGYEFGVEAPLPFGLTVRGERHYRPVDLAWREYTPARGEQLSSAPSYLTDGDASVRGDSLVLERRFGSTWSYVSLGRGTADGNLAVVTPFDAPVQRLEQRNVRFSSGQMGLRFPRTGTELRAEYQRVEDEAFVPADQVEEPVRRYFHIRVSQQLAWLETLGTSWRLVVVGRAAADERSQAEPVLVSRRGLMDRQISAGVAVAF